LAAAAGHGDLRPPARGGAEIEHALSRPEQAEAIVEFDQLERRPRPPALTLRLGDIGIVQLALQPPRRRVAALASRAHANGHVPGSGTASAGHAEGRPCAAPGTDAHRWPKP